MPLAAFLKQYFAENKKFGSKDRRYIAHVCYCYYRLGHALKEHAFEVKVQTALFLCDDSDDWNILYDAEWMNNKSGVLQKRIDFIRTVFPDLSLQDIFPWVEELSNGIEAQKFITSHFIQPDLFLRIRPGNKKNVLQKLTGRQTQFKQLSNDCISLPNATRVDDIVEIDKEVVVQDFSSQRVASFLWEVVGSEPAVVRVWDCCAASGGKSILAYDIIPNIDLTVSDIRPTIIQNLKKRFERAGIKNYHSFITNLTGSRRNTADFKLIICDAPCTGSGTWGRTPEQLCFFPAEQINEYAALQEKIVRSIIPDLSINSYFLYITCSVFKKENEDMVEIIEEEFSLEVVKKELLKGYGLKADSMFAVLFVKKVKSS